MIVWVSEHYSAQRDRARHSKKERGGVSRTCEYLCRRAAQTYTQTRAPTEIHKQTGREIDTIQEHIHTETEKGGETETDRDNERESGISVTVSNSLIVGIRTVSNR